MTITVVAEINSARAVTGAATFNSALASMRAGVATTGASLRGFGAAIVALRTPIAGVALALGATGLAAIKAGDDFAQLKARLGNVAQAGTSAEGLLGGIAEAAERSRAPVLELANIYRRTAQALTDLKFTEAQGIRMTETLAKVTKISGVSTGEASAAMLQFSQALVSGKLQGDEFRSISENMPEILRILEKQLGKTGKELREMAEQGAISGKLLAQALLNAGADIDKKFANIPKSVGEAWAQLTNQFTLTFGEIATNTGLTKGFADALDGVRGMLRSEEFRAGATLVAENIAALGSAIKTVAGFIPEAVTQFKAWQSVLSETDAYKTAASWATWFLNRMKENHEWMMNGGKEGPQALRDSYLDAGHAVETMADKAAKAAERIRVVQSMRGSLAPTPIVRASDNPNAPGAIKLEETDLQKDIRRMREAEALKRQIAQAEARADGEAMRALEMRLEIHGRITEEMRKKEAAGAKALEADIRATAEAKRQLEIVSALRQVETARMENDLARAELDFDRVKARALQTELAVRQTVTQEMRLQHPELAKQLEGEARVTEELRRRKTVQDELNEKGETFARTIADGFKEGAKEGKNFGEIVRGITARIVEMAVEMAIIGPLVKGAGRSFGGVMQGMGVEDASDPLGLAGMFGSASTAGFGFASGGVFGSPVALAGSGWRGVMAESGPEAIMPLRRGPDGRLGVAAAGGQSAPVITINVAGDATDETVAKLRQVAREEFAAGAPGLVKASVGAVAGEYRRDPAYLRR